MMPARKTAPARGVLSLATGGLDARLGICGIAVVSLALLGGGRYSLDRWATGDDGPAASPPHRSSKVIHDPAPVLG